MKNFKAGLAIVVVLSVGFTFGQSVITDSIRNEITAYYKMLQGNTVTISSLKHVTPSLELLDNNTIEGDDNINAITINDIIHNNWTQVAVCDLKIAIHNAHGIVVTGVFSGRQLTECEFITTKFRHHWERRPKIKYKLVKQ